MSTAKLSIESLKQKKTCKAENMKLSKTSLNRIKKYLSNKPVKKAYLFGSFVREEANNFSDIDILVELDYTQKIGLEFVRMQIELQDLLKRKVDLLSVRSLSKYLRPFIDQEKILIYEK